MLRKRVHPRLPARLLRRLCRGASGQSLIEFALILPLLILLLLGIVQFGAIFTGLLALNAAAREGARQAAVAWPEAGAQGKIEAAVERVLPTGLFLAGPAAPGIIIEYPEGKESGKYVRVTVTGEVYRFVPLPQHQAEPGAPAGESPLQFTVSAVMRLETAPQP